MLSFPVTLVILLSFEESEALAVVEDFFVEEVCVFELSGAVSVFACWEEVFVEDLVFEALAEAAVLAVVALLTVSDALLAVSEAEFALADALTIVGADPFRAQLLSKVYFLPPIVLVPVAAAPLAVM